MNWLGKSLKVIARNLRDQPFLSLILGLTIVLAIVAVLPTNLGTQVVVAVVIVVLFVIYLLFLSRESPKSELKDDRVFRDLALRISLVLKDEGYVPGNNRQQDLGATLVAKMRETKGVLNQLGGKAMAEEFIQAFNVPPSLIGPMDEKENT